MGRERARQRPGQRRRQAATTSSATPPTSRRSPSIRPSPNRMAIGWRQFDTITSNFRQAGLGLQRPTAAATWTFPGVLEPGVFRSRSGARRRRRRQLLLQQPGGRAPGLTAATSSSRPTAARPGELRCYAYGGDKQWMAVDRTGGIGDGQHLPGLETTPAAAATTGFNRSTDGGAELRAAGRDARQPELGHARPSAPDGALYVGRHRPINGSRLRRRSIVDRPGPAVAPIAFDGDVVGRSRRRAVASSAPAPTRAVCSDRSGSPSITRAARPRQRLRAGLGRSAGPGSARRALRRARPTAA